MKKSPKIEKVMGEFKEKNYIAGQRKGLSLKTESRQWLLL